MQKRSSADWWTVLVAGALYVGLPVVAAWEAIVKMLSNEGASGWVQAVGSIATLIIAFAVMFKQQADARALEAERRLNDKLDAVDGVNALLLRLRLYLRRAERPEPRIGDSINCEPPVLVTWDSYKYDFQPSFRALKNVQPHTFGAAAFFVQTAIEQVEAADESIVSFLKIKDQLDASVAHDPHGEKSRDRRLGIQGRLALIARRGHDIQTSIESIANGARAQRTPRH